MNTNIPYNTNWGGEAQNWGAQQQQRPKYVHLVLNPYTGQLEKSGSKFSGSGPSAAAKKYINSQAAKKLRPQGAMGFPQHVILLDPKTGRVKEFVGWVEPLQSHEHTPWRQQNNRWTKAVVQPYNSGMF